MGASHVLVKFQCLIFLWLWREVGSAAATNALLPIAKPGCQDRCGNISIPFPFGIGKGCFIDEDFEILCSNPTNPICGYLNVSNISIPDGHMTVDVYVSTDCSDKKKAVNDITWAKFRKFTLSDTKNKFITMGCDTYGYLELGEKQNFTALGCTSVCNTMDDITEGCSGIGCCEASIPPGLAVYNTTVKSMFKPRRDLSFNPCSYAFIIEESSFNFSKSYLKDFNNYGSEMVPVVVDWTVGNETCTEAEKNTTSYACGPNTDCIPGKSAPGYRCNCKNGYQGNPYLDISTGGHCQGDWYHGPVTLPLYYNDIGYINECNDIKLYEEAERCERRGNICNNTEGGFTCPCRDGFRSIYEKNGISDCIPHSNKLIVGVCIGLLLIVVTLVGSFWSYWGYRKRKHMQVKEEFFKKNGGLILNQLLDEREVDIEANRNGRGGKKHRSIATIYTEKDLSKATNNYHESQILDEEGLARCIKESCLTELWLQLRRQRSSIQTKMSNS